MVDVHHHDRRQPGAAQPVEQLVGHPLRDHDRQPGVDPQPPQMGDLGQPAGKMGKPGVRQAQRVAAAEDHLLDRRFGGRQLQGRFPVGRRRRPDVPIREMPAKTETAMDGARPTCHDQESALILPQQAGCRAAAASPSGSAANCGASASSSPRGQDLDSSGSGVAGTDPGQVGPGTSSGKSAGGLPASAATGGQPEQPAQLARVADRIGQDRLPLGRRGDAAAATRRPPLVSCRG